MRIERGAGMAAGWGKLALALAGVASVAGAVTWFGVVAPRRSASAQKADPVQAEVPVLEPSPGVNTGVPTLKTGETSQSTMPLVPSFDVVRVEPDGEAVIAGRSTPGATIDLLRNGEPYARVMADPSGLFASVPSPFPPGSHELVLQSIAPNGMRTRSRQSVTVVIGPGRDVPPLVALVSPDQPTVVLSGPDQSAPRATPDAFGDQPKEAGAPAETGRRAGVKVATVEVQENGRLFVSGKAAPGATIRLYLNDTLVAPGAAAQDGRLAFVIERGLRAGDYHVRLDDVDPVSGEVRSRAEVDFAVPLQVLASDTPVPSGTPAPAEVAEAKPGTTPATPQSGTEGTTIVPQVNTATVARGDNLWRISRRTYGHGLRYTVIYGANQPQIRNPDRIYPGQIFVLPGEAQPPATPARP